MKLLLAQPSIPRFQWELEVLLTNLRRFGNFEIVLLFSRPHDVDDTVPYYLANKYGAQCFVFKDGRFNKTYNPSIRPYLLWQYFRTHPEAEAEQYFYIDSDIIFREWPDFATFTDNRFMVYGADCSSYLDYDYIMKCTNGQEIAERMARICGITVDQMKDVPGIGAQLILNKPDAEFWREAYENTESIYQMLAPIDSNIQKWTAEMWGQLWTWVRWSKTLIVSDELSFSRPTDDIQVWYDHKIMHNAGALADSGLFFKGRYVHETPFGQDFGSVPRNKVSYKYVQAIEKVVF